jgi:hypothetical protein
VEAEEVEVVAVAEAEVVEVVAVAEAEVAEAVEAVEEEAETPLKTRSYQPPESRQWAHYLKNSTETELWRTTLSKKSNNICALTAT